MILHFHDNNKFLSATVESWVVRENYKGEENHKEEIVIKFVTD